MQLTLSFAIFISSLVSVISQAPQLTVNLRQRYTLNASVRSRFSCSFIGSPAPTITWTYNGESLPGTAQGSGPYVDPSTGSLVLTRARPSDSGSYSCIATNIHGSTSASTEITIVRNNGAAPWYTDWYMIILYVLVVWALLIPIFIAWFYYAKRKETKDLPPADPWIGN